MDWVIDRKTLVDITKHIGGETNESGGILGCSREGFIDAFYFDRGKRSTVIDYLPNVEALQVQLDRWNNSNIRFVGFAHSHKYGGCLSDKDIYMAREILKANSNMDTILMPILLLRNEQLYLYEVSELNVYSLKYNIL